MLSDGHLPHRSRFFALGWKQITNLSGGEKTLASLSLVFALHHYRQGHQIPSLCWRCCGVLLFNLCSASLLGCNCCNILDVKSLGKATFAYFCSFHQLSIVCVCATNKGQINTRRITLITYRLARFLDASFIDQQCFQSCHATETISNKIYSIGCF